MTGRAGSTCVSRCPRVLSLFSVAPSSIGGFYGGSEWSDRSRCDPSTKRSRNPELLRALITEPAPFARRDCLSHSDENDNVRSQQQRIITLIIVVVIRVC